MQHPFYTIGAISCCINILEYKIFRMCLVHFSERPFMNTDEISCNKDMYVTVTDPVI